MGSQNACPNGQAIYNHIPMTKLTISIPDDLKKQLDIYCKQQHIRLDEAVCESLRRYLLIEQFRALRRRTIPYAIAQGLLTDEDVFLRFTNPQSK